MDINIKKLVSGLILIFGLILFLSSLFNNNINLSLVVLSLSLILWVIFGLMFDAFDITIFAWILSGAGFLLSIAIFFIFGIEEIAHPVGAIVFHLGGIAGSLGVALFSLFPILILYQLNYKGLPIRKNDNQNKPANTNFESEIKSDDWEVVSEEDLESGNFEIR